jgi:hypothetical protein
MDKQRYLDVAQVIDQFRLVPRFIFFAYGVWIIHVTRWVLNWYMALPATERTLEASGLAATIISVITGLFPWIYRIYSDNANDWSESTPTTRTQVISATTETK